MLTIPNEIIELFKKDSVRKNFRVKFLDRIHNDIINDNIIDGSVKFNESLCSRNSIKFGLCEASTLQFECVNIDDISGAIISAELDIDCTSLADKHHEFDILTSPDLSYPYYPVPYGIFAIESAKKQSDMRRRKVIAYSNEHIVDYSVPESMKALSKYSWNGKETIYLSGDNLLDLIFPTYSYARHENEIQRTTDELNGVVLASHSFNAGGKKYEAELAYHRSHIAQGNQKVIYTYRTHYDPNEYSRILAEANEYIKGLGGEPFNTWSWVYNRGKAGEPYTLCFENSYATFTYSGTEVTNVKAGMLSESNFVDIITDNVPHTLLKIHREESNKSTGIAVFTNDNGVANWVDDLGGTIALPSKIIIRNADSQRKVIAEFKTSNYLEYYAEELGASGIIKLVSKSESRRIYNLNMNKREITSRTTRSDFSFAKALEEDFAKELRNIVESHIELKGKLGKFDRSGVFRLFNLTKDNNIYPSPDLYPDRLLFPRDISKIHITRDIYKSIWCDDETTLPIQNIIANYKNKSNEDAYVEYNIPISEEHTRQVASKDYVPEVKTYQEVMFAFSTSPLNDGKRTIIKHLGLSKIKIMYTDSYGNSKTKEFEDNTDSFEIKDSEIIANASRIIRIIFSDNQEGKESSYNFMLSIKQEINGNWEVMYETSKKTTASTTISTYFDWVSYGETAPIEANRAFTVESSNASIISIDFEYLDDAGIESFWGYASFAKKSVTIDDETFLQYADRITYANIKFATEDSGTVEILQSEYNEKYYEGNYMSYDISNNYYIKNNTYSEEEILKMMKELGNAIGGFRYTPMKASIMGQLYLEPGDWIHVVDGQDSFVSLILQRSLTGIHTLTDTYEAKG